MTDRTTLDIDFQKARRHAQLESIFSTLRWKNPNLLSFYEVTKLVRPESECYKGMQAIPVAKIIGSENRYHDFSAAFYPKSPNLRFRWENVDKARLEDVILPPISVYQLGEWYFVRDGNHRVSVAKANGLEFIDAEVVELSSRIPLEEGMTMNELKRRVVNFERQQFLAQYQPTYLPMEKIVFTSPGSYPEMVNHINVHKYYINLDKDYEISFEEAARSWYEKVYRPIVVAAEAEQLLSEFPGQTEADIYIWLVRKWDELKRIHAATTEGDAAKAMKEEEKDKTLSRWVEYLKEQLKRD
ncbi:MAG: transcriptional regulator [Spirochaetales bacterium]|nr:transcriptional regulator [Candidatus Physcosoma equi]